MSASVSSTMSPVSTAWFGPHAGVAVGLQLEAHRHPTSGPRGRRRPGVVAQQVLDVVAVLVGDHVGLGERAALGAEPGPQLVVEAEVDVDLLSRPGSRRARPPTVAGPHAGGHLRR